MRYTIFFFLNLTLFVWENRFWSEDFLNFGSFIFLKIFLSSEQEKYFRFFVQNFLKFLVFEITIFFLVFEISKIQFLIPLILDSIDSVPKGLMPPEALINWFLWSENFLNFGWFIFLKIFLWSEQEKYSRFFVRNF